MVGWYSPMVPAYINSFFLYGYPDAVQHGFIHLVGIRRPPFNMTHEDPEPVIFYTGTWGFPWGPRGYLDVQGSFQAMNQTPGESVRIVQLDNVKIYWPSVSELEIRIHGVSHTRDGQVQHVEVDVGPGRGRQTPDVERSRQAIATPSGGDVRGKRPSSAPSRRPVLKVHGRTFLVESPVDEGEGHAGDNIREPVEAAGRSVEHFVIAHYTRVLLSQ